VSILAPTPSRSLKKRTSSHSLPRSVGQRNPRGDRRVDGSLGQQTEQCRQVFAQPRAQCLRRDAAPAPKVVERGVERIRQEVRRFGSAGLVSRGRAKIHSERKASASKVSPQLSLALAKTALPDPMPAKTFDQGSGNKKEASRALPLVLAAASSVTRCNAVANSRLISCQKVNKSANRQMAHSR
jgi:hypothetical protein